MPDGAPSLSLSKERAVAWWGCQSVEKLERCDEIKARLENHQATNALIYRGGVWWRDVSQVQPKETHDKFLFLLHVLPIKTSRKLHTSDK